MVNRKTINPSHIPAIYTADTSVGNNVYASNGELFSKTSGSPKVLRRSIDGGYTWTNGYTFTESIQNCLKTKKGTLIVSCDDNAYALPIGKIYRSTDNGVTFTSVLTLSAGGAIYWSLVQNNNSIFASEYGTYPCKNVWRSTDDGATWAIVYTAPVSSSVHIHGLATDPSDDSAVAFATGDDYDKIGYSTNGGATFVEMSITIPQITVIAFKSPYIFLFTDDGTGKIYRDTKANFAANTVSLTEVFNGLTRSEGNFKGQIYACSVDEYGHIYAGIQDEANVSFGKGSIFMSANNGDSWSLVKSYEKIPSVTAGPFLMSSGREGGIRIFIGAVESSGSITPNPFFRS